MHLFPTLFRINSINQLINATGSFAMSVEHLRFIASFPLSPLNVTISQNLDPYHNTPVVASLESINRTDGKSTLLATVALQVSTNCDQHAKFRQWTAG